MIQFNLLPDVKLGYIKARRTKRLVTTVSFAVMAVLVVIFMLVLATVYVVQKKQLSDADKSVKTYTAKLKSEPNLNKVLTIKNQLGTLVSLHQSKVVSSRLFVYLPEITPTNVNLGKLNIDFTSNTMTVDGTTNSLASVNTYIDTLKFTTYDTADGVKGNKAFPSVTETSFGLTQGTASYTLSVQFDPALFASANAVTLNVPSLTTTRSVVDDPGLFNGKVGTPATDTTKGVQ